MNHSCSVRRCSASSGSVYRLRSLESILPISSRSSVMTRPDLERDLGLQFLDGLSNYFRTQTNRFLGQVVFEEVGV